MDAIIQTIEPILFLCFSIPLIYLFVFAIAALFRRTDTYPPARKKHRYAVLIPKNSVFVTQNYPVELYDVISTDSLYETIKEIDTAKYDLAVILGKTDRVSPNLLDEINRAYEAGATALQLHHILTPRNSRKLRMKAINEEIRNSFFKQGQIRIGLSSAMDGKDMVLEFAWLKKNLKNPKSNLEKRLARQNIYVEYLENSCVESSEPRIPQYHVKVSRTIAALPEAIMTSNWDYLNKLVQWLLPSWITLLAGTTLIAILMTAYEWTYSLKWWGILFMLIFTICLAIPDYLVEKTSKKK